MVDVAVLKGGFRPTYSWGAPPCMISHGFGCFMMFHHVSVELKPNRHFQIFWHVATFRSGTNPESISKVVPETSGKTRALLHPLVHHHKPIEYDS